MNIHCQNESRIPVSVSLTRNIKKYRWIYVQELNLIYKAEVISTSYYTFDKCFRSFSYFADLFRETLGR